MIRRSIRLGPKHNTPTYYVNGVPLDFYDISAYIVLHEWDNAYRQYPSYPKEKSRKWIYDLIELAHSLGKRWYFTQFVIELETISKKYYRNRMKEVDLNITPLMPKIVDLVEILDPNFHINARARLEARL